MSSDELLAALEAEEYAHLPYGLDILLKKLILASKKLNITNIAIAGGVSANSGLRDKLISEGEKLGWQVFIPKPAFTTDNAAMVAIVGYFKYLSHDFCAIHEPPFARVEI